MDPLLTGAQVLDEVAYLATIEHALIVDYLLIRYTVGAGIDEVIGEGPDAVQLRKAAKDAEQLAIASMRHLHATNRLLVIAGRSPEVSRATHIVPETGPAIPVASLTAAQFDGFPRREKAIAGAVDRRYERLQAAVQSPVPGLSDEVQQAIVFLSLNDHTAALGDLIGHIGTLPPSTYLRVTRTVPENDAERRLLAASDGYYHAIVAASAATFGDETELFGLLQDEGVTAMNTLDAYNGHLARARLLPAFTMPPGFGG